MAADPRDRLRLRGRDLALALLVVALLAAALVVLLANLRGVA